MDTLISFKGPQYPKSVILYDPPTMRFVAIKTVEQQSLLSRHRARDFLIRQRLIRQRTQSLSE